MRPFTVDLHSKFKGSGIFVHENLTQERQRWFNMAKQNPSVERVWTQDGRIEVRRKDGSRVVIGKGSDLGKLR